MTESSTDETRCPGCGFTGRQANVWKGGILVRSCRDPWHNRHQPPDVAPQPAEEEP